MQIDMLVLHMQANFTANNNRTVFVTRCVIKHALWHSLSIEMESVESEGSKA
jgi:hypothetical protein